MIAAYRDAGGRGPLHLQVHLSWAPSRPRGRRRSRTTSGAATSSRRRSAGTWNSPSTSTWSRQDVPPSEVAEVVNVSADLGRHAGWLQRVRRAGLRPDLPAPRRAGAGRVHRRLRRQGAAETAGRPPDHHAPRVRLGSYPMEALFEVVVFLAIATFGAALARRLGLLAPILLVVLGLGLSFVPGFPEVRLDPELVLIGILPPLLYVAALETSVPAFRFNLRPILLLAVGLVLFTAFAVGLRRARAAARACRWPSASPSARWSRRPTRSRPPRSPAGSACPAGWSPSSRARACSTTRPRWCCSGSAVAAAAVGTARRRRRRSPARCCVAAGGGILVGALGAVVVRLPAPAHHRPAAGQRAVAARPRSSVVVRRRGGPRLRRGRGRGDRAVPRATGMPTLMSAASRLQMGAFWRMVKFLLEGPGLPAGRAAAARGAAATWTTPAGAAGRGSPPRCSRAVV